jgi:hypothetical protein
MKQLEQSEIEVLIANAKNPIALSNYSYPLNDLDDRIFEILTYSVFKRRLADKAFKNRFDDVSLMQGVGEKGMDCVLLKKNRIVATIQCKKYAKNLSDTTILSELIKFSIHFFLDKSRFDLSEKFKYFVATSTGYTGKALKLPEQLKDKSFLQSYNFEEIATSMLNKYKAFENLSYDDIKDEIPNIIRV